MNREKKTILIMLGILAAVALCFFAYTRIPWENLKKTTPSATPDEEGTAMPTANATGESVTNPTVTITMKSGDVIHLELYPQYAPNTVANFISLANSGYYDGVIFHRIIDDFMIQGGDPTGSGTGGPGYTIAGEFSENGFTQNTLKHEPGVISMARTNLSYDTAGSQFFIMVSATKSLDGLYAAFGRVTDDESLQVCYNLGKVDTDINDRPVEEQQIETIRVETYGKDYGDPVKID